MLSIRWEQIGIVLGALISTASTLPLAMGFVTFNSILWFDVVVGRCNQELRANVSVSGLARLLCQNLSGLWRTLPCSCGCWYLRDVFA